MNKLLIVALSLVAVGGVSTAFAYDELGSGLLKKCESSTLGLQGWSHLQGWCSVIDSQKTIIEQNNEIIELLKMNNCLTANSNHLTGTKKIECNYEQLENLD